MIWPFPMSINVSVEQLELCMTHLGQRLPHFEKRGFIAMRLFHHITPRLQHYFNELLGRHDLTETVWYALIALYASPKKTLFPSDLSDVLDLTRTSATRLSDELVAKGLIMREPSLEDRRKIVLSLTETGVALVERVAPELRDARLALLADFSDEDLQQLESLLRRLLAHLGG